MKLYEHEAADIFAHLGIPFPDRMTAATPEEARAAAEKIGCPVVVKAQVLAGGRGLAGGVKTASSPEEAHAAAESILGSCIRGLVVVKVMISQKIEIVNELYLGITVDGGKGQRGRHEHRGSRKFLTCQNRLAAC
jgi:succinyl-CoA synthetase beta subunit